VFDKVTIAYRGAGYELGQGRGFYGVWAVGAPRDEPLQRWAETPDGWSAAWTRFASLEAPGTIAPVGRSVPPAGSAGPQAARSPASGPYTAPYNAPYGAGPGPAAGARGGALVAAGLLVAGVILGVAGLFPGYLGGVSLASRSDQVLPHAIYLGGWTVGAVLILLGGARMRPGALLSLGLSAVTFGLFFSDAGLAIGGSGTSGGAGLVLSLIGWFACAAGSVLAFVLRPSARPAPAGQPGSLGRPRGAASGPVVMMILAALGAAAAFAPAWDSYTLRTAAGQTQSLTLGNAFSGSNPGLVTTGDVLTMILVAVTVIVASFWRPVRHGGLLLAGATLPVAAQAISALMQITQPASPAQFGISNAQASQLGLTITSSLTPAFWIFSGFAVVLLVSCVWMLFTPPQPVMAGLVPPAGPAGDGLSAAPPENLDAEAHDTDDDEDIDDDDHIGDEEGVGEPDGTPAHGAAARP
jgi:hypothetical protein